jgi:hypothetical protein
VGNALCSHLSTKWAVEDNPYGEVLGEVLETVLGSSSDEHNVAGLECISLALVPQDSSAAHDKVDLVLCMRSLLVRRHRERELEGEAAALQDTDGVLTGGTRYTCLHVRQMDHKTTIWITHAALLVSVHLLFHSNLSGLLAETNSSRNCSIGSFKKQR